MTLRVEPSLFVLTRSDQDQSALTAKSDHFAGQPQAFRSSRSHATPTFCNNDDRSVISSTNDEEQTDWRSAVSEVDGLLIGSGPVS